MPQPPRPCSAVDALAVAVDIQPVPAEQVVAGAPLAGAADLEALDGRSLVVGVWEHGVGVSTDVEADEIFVVVAGRATVEVEGGPVLELVTGTVGFLRAGARTVWTVHEPLRKVYVLG